MNDRFREDITTTLQRLSTAFTTRDIMVHEDRLLWADSIDQANQMLLQNPSFDVIPLKHENEYRHYVKRGIGSPSLIEVEHLISDSTPILELPSLFCRMDFYFVLSVKRIVGFIHFSDLNSQLVKIPYFVLLEAVESRMAAKIEAQVTDSDLDSVLSKTRSNVIKKRIKDLEKEHADLGYVNFMYFPEMIEFARLYNVLSLEENDLKVITEIRNRVDHADRPLIKFKDDAQKLARTRVICLDLLSQLAN